MSIKLGAYHLLCLWDKDTSIHDDTYSSLLPNAQLTGKKLLAKIGERSEQKANCILSCLKFLLVLNFALNEQANANRTNKKGTTTIK